MPDDTTALVLQVSADVRALQRQMTQATRIVDQSMRVAEGRAQQGARRIEASFAGLNVGRFGDVLGGQIGRGLSGLTAGAGAVGTALSALGPAGFAAAAGIAALGSAIAGAIRTAEWAESLGDAANQLHLTTTRLQEMDFAATAAGAPIEAMRTTLQGLQSAMGAAVSGSDRAGRRFRAIFNELGISPQDLAGLHDVTELLPLIAQGLERVGSARAARIGDLLHINPEILHELEQGRDRINELTTAAARYGVVLDESVIQRSAQAADSMRLARGVIDAELRVAFANLAPAIDNSSTAIVRIIAKLNELLGSARDSAAGIWDLIRGLQAIPRDIAVRLQITASQNPTTGLPGLLAASAAGIVRRDPLARITLDALGANNRIQSNARQAGRMAADVVGGLGGAILGERAEANRTHTVLGDLDAASGRHGRGGGRGATTRPEAHWIVVPGGPEGRGIWVLIDATGHRVDQFIVGGPNAGASFPAAAHDALSPDNLDHPFARPANTDSFSLSGFQSTDTVMDALAQGLEENRDRLAGQWADIISGGLDAGMRDGWPGVLRYVLQTWQRAIAQNLANSLGNLLAGDGLGNGGGGIVGAIGRGIGSLFGVGHNATGTTNWRGGPTWVGEGGPEIVVPPAGSRIVPAGLSRAMAAVAAGPGNRGTVVHQTFDLRGSVVLEKLYADMQRISQQNAARAAGGALKVAQKGMAGQMRAEQLLKG